MLRVRDAVKYRNDGSVGWVSKPSTNRFYGSNGKRSEKERMVSRCDAMLCDAKCLIILGVDATGTRRNLLLDGSITRHGWSPDSENGSSNGVEFLEMMKCTRNEWFYVLCFGC